MIVVGYNNTCWICAGQTKFTEHLNTNKIILINSADFKMALSPAFCSSTWWNSYSKTLILGA